MPLAQSRAITTARRIDGKYISARLNRSAKLHSSVVLSHAVDEGVKFTKLMAADHCRALQAGCGKGTAPSGHIS